MRPFQRTKRASALITVMIVSVIASIATVSLLSFHVHQRRALESLLLYQGELQAAESLVNSMVARISYYGTHKPSQIAGTCFLEFERAVLEVRPTTLIDYEVRDADGVELDSNGSEFVRVLCPRSDPNDPNSARTDCEFDPSDTCDSVNDSSLFQTIDTGAWAGYTIAQRAYRVSAYAKDESRQRSGLLDQDTYRGVLVGRTVTVQLIPPYLFAIFFNGAGGIDAGPEIDILGRVHMNGDMFATKGGSAAWYHENVTVAGNFHAQEWDPTNLRTDGRDNSSLRLRTNVDGMEDYTRTYDGTTHDFADTQNPGDYTDGQLDSDDPNWTALAQEVWGGYVRDRSHGVERISFPIPDDVSPRALIERPSATDIGSVRDAKLANQADVVVRGDPRDPTSWQAYSSWALAEAGGAGDVPITTDVNGTPTSWLSNNALYNARERKVVHSIDINMDVLGDAVANGDVPIDTGILYVTPDTPAEAGYEPVDNGLPYYAGGNNETQHAVRIIEGSNVPTNASGALTLATDAPVYVKGDLNIADSADRALLLVAGDAVNILSNAFDDAEYDPFNEDNTDSWATRIRNGDPQSSWDDTGERDGASDTEMNAIFLGGETASRAQDHPTHAHNYGRYSGGGENWFRFLETWSGDDFVFEGSMLNMWESEIATASWDKNNGSGTSAGYYSPPRRKWSWDPNLASIVPPAGFPNFFVIQYSDWAVGRDYETDPAFEPPPDEI
jgi:hypothetical protein